MSTVQSPSSRRDVLPADAVLSRRLLDQHMVAIDALGGDLVLAPVDLSRTGLRILESGTADGHWLQELGKQCIVSKDNTYIGTDVNPSFFPTAYPPDYQFYKHNVADPWPASEHSTYDLVHQRLTLPGAAPTQLSQAVHNLFALVKPGGWIQLVEAEQIAPGAGPVFNEFLNLVRDVFDTSGAGWKYAQQMRGWLEDEGAVEITETLFDMELGATNKDKNLREMGASSTAGAMEGLVRHAKAMGLKTTLTEEEMNTLPQRLYAELAERGANYPLRCVWGRKRL